MSTVKVLTKNRTCDKCGKRLTKAIRIRYCSWQCRYRGTVLERFMEKVHKTDSCWIWVGGKNAKGYGSFGGDEGVKSAHRYSWLLHKGAIPSGLHVLHTCDNPPCVNPSHLWLGTNKDNTNDKVKKGRHAHGSRSAFAKLTEELVVEIRKRYATEKISQRELADIYGVDHVNIGAAIRRASWKHVP